MNGDGLSDVVLSAPSASYNGRPGSGSTYVVFGRRSSTTVDLASLGAGGFRIDGAAAGDYAGSSVAGAGDVDGDGRGDVIVGAGDADNNGRPDSGSAYVVFGSANERVDLAVLGADAFRIDGAAAGDFAGSTAPVVLVGQAVSGAGDINSDGLSDLIVGAVGADPTGPFSGSAYVVFGPKCKDPGDGKPEPSAPRARCKFHR